ncbi:MAG: hypothetical protein ACYCZL_02860 [Polaromonas sp.]
MGAIEVDVFVAQPLARNPHEVEVSSVGQPQVKWRKKRILGAGGQGNGVFVGLADTASLPGTAPVLALRAKKIPTDKGWDFKLWW